MGDRRTGPFGPARLCAHDVEATSCRRAPLPSWPAVVAVAATVLASDLRRGSATRPRRRPFGAGSTSVVGRRRAPPTTVPADPRRSRWWATRSPSAARSSSARASRRSAWRSTPSIDAETAGASWRTAVASGVDAVTRSPPTDAPDLWVIALGTNDVGVLDRPRIRAGDRPSCSRRSPSAPRSCGSTSTWSPTRTNRRVQRDAALGARRPRPGHGRRLGVARRRGRRAHATASTRRASASSSSHRPSSAAVGAWTG